MAQLPGPGEISSFADEGAAKAGFEAQRDKIAQMPGGQPREALVIAGGEVTPSLGWVSVSAEGGAGPDDLDTIQTGNFEAGAWLVVQGDSLAAEVVVKHGTGNLLTADSNDVRLNGPEDFVMFGLEGGNWREFCRSGTDHGSEVVPLAASYVAKNDDLGKHFTNEGSAGTIALDLPAAATIGTTITASVVAGNEFQVIPIGGDVIRDGNTTSATGRRNSTQGSVLFLQVVSVGVWLSLSTQGNWQNV